MSIVNEYDGGGAIYRPATDTVKFSERDCDTFALMNICAGTLEKNEAVNDAKKSINIVEHLWRNSGANRRQRPVTVAKAASEMCSPSRIAQTAEMNGTSSLADEIQRIFTVTVI